MSDKNETPVIFLMGPTAAGKTDIAVQLVEALPCEIISVDSALIYRGMDIGTAKPDAEMLARAPHRLIDICEPTEAYSAARFRSDALLAIEEIIAQGKIPLLVGGTMLYFRALSEGLSPLPSADAAVRARLEADAERIGWGEMHERLVRIDPESAARIHQNDPQRIQRALEVYEISGRSMTELTQNGVREPFPYPIKKLIVAPPARAELHRRIERRFEQMMAQGFLDEVKGLFAREDLHAGLPAIRSVGYRQLWMHLAGKLTFDEAVERGIIATRQLAKRQITWLRAEKDEKWVDGSDENVMNVVLKLLSISTI
ncbi:MAG: tRNA (adenosine(37)-N6)-dimethylallyltransferase MiaA [Gammaproteobacteria bacterium]|nr:tRNA (adenosine(37)-N6)-dimethylallyltransferase MiaA [Gammaproteobacteria bacterium]